ncbi:MAG: phosphohydrolase [Candidatus Cloacimonetes bacterium]|nr:phosphohydrolase [Candidatus Cloacimonadota bacterium]
MKSKKQIVLEKRLHGMLTGTAQGIADALFADEEVQAMQEYANTVSIKRLGFNDHGPVHMCKAAINSLKMFQLLLEAGVKPNLVKEEVGTQEDSIIAVLMASLLHDVGMSVARGRHEFMGLHLAMPTISRLLEQFFPGDITRQVILRSLITECIFGHMATQPIHSIEAGLVLVGDGCDMEWGRSRIPSLIPHQPRVGDIHRYSSSAVRKVRIAKGVKKPIRITVTLDQSVGFFQIEEVLYPKIASSPIKGFIELHAGVEGDEMLVYL